jgi:hypothetical protein
MALATTTIIAVAALAASAYGMKRQQDAMQAARKDQKKASDVSAAETAAQRQQNIRDQVRQDRIRRAQIISDSANTGTTASSGEIGAVSSIGTQVASNVGSINRGANSQAGYNNYMQGAANAQGSAQTWQAITGLTSSAAGFAMNTRGFQSDFNRIFSNPDTTKTAIY